MPPKHLSPRVETRQRITYRITERPRRARPSRPNADPLTHSALDMMRASRWLLAATGLAFAITIALTTVVPGANAFESGPTGSAQRISELRTTDQRTADQPITGQRARTLGASAQSVTVSSAVLQTGTTRDPYGVTVKPALQWPLPPATRISTGFGLRTCAGCSRDHQGADFNAPPGTPIQSMAAGVVVETNATGYQALGVHVRIQHLIDGDVVTSVYGHMQTGSMNLAVGDYVAVGQVLGTEGCTGSCTGDHLHFEVHPGGGAAVDPVAWLHAKLG